MLSASSLIRWLRLHDSRRRRHSPAARFGVVVPIAIGAGLALEVARRGPGTASSELWLALLLLAVGLAFATAAFRLFWSQDAAALARHPIPGRALFRLGWRRNLRLCQYLLAVPGVGLLGIASAGAEGFFFRHVALWIIAAGVCTCVAPAVALIAGGVAASDRADALARSLGGEFRAPSGAALAVLPGFFGGGAAILLATSYSWLLGGRHGVWPGVGGAALLVAASAWVLADRRASQTMPNAVRELSALNRHRFAHIEATALTLLESFYLALSRRRLRPYIAKDLRLIRRRYPAYALAIGLGCIVSWGDALFGSGELGRVLVILALLQLYGVIMTSRTCAPPIEEQRLWATMPLTARERRTIKIATGHMRAVTATALVATPLFVIDAAPRATSFLVAAAGVTTIANWIVVRLRIR